MSKFMFSKFILSEKHGSKWVKVKASIRHKIRCQVLVLKLAVNCFLGPKIWSWNEKQNEMTAFPEGMTSQLFTIELMSDIEFLDRPFDLTS